MKKITASDPLAHSADVVADHVEQLKGLFPEVLTDGKVDFDVLRQLLGDTVDDREEKYGLNWHGKRQARQLALTPSTGTLRPRPDQSDGWDATKNIFIEGDNLEVLKLLQKSYAGKVKLIYIDPPYNTGKDFVYPDDYRDNIRNYLELTGQADGQGRRWSSNTEASGRFHTDWLNMMYPRLKLAQSLLRDDGALFLSIDDNEVSNASQLVSEIFGPENVIGTFIWEKRRSRENRKSFSVNHDYILCVARNRPVFELTRGLLPLTEEARERYGNPDNDSRGVWQSVAITAQAGHGTKNQFYTIVTPSGRRLDPPSGNCWRFTRERLNALIEDGRIWFGKDGGNVPRQKMFLAEQDEGLTPQTIWTAEEVGTTDSAKRSLNDIFGGASVFETPKSVELIRRIIDIAAGKDGLIVDFFAGVGVTGEATIRANAADGGSRRYILVQLPEPIDPEKPEAGPAIAFCREAKIPATLTALAQERMRRVAREVSKADSLDKRGDCGQRVFSLAASNIRSWNPRPDDLGDLLTRSADNILDGRTEEDLLFEVIIKLGLELVTPIERKTVVGKTVYAIGAGVLMACLVPKLKAADVEALGLGIVNWHRALAPTGETTIVFRDGAFPDDVAKTNLTAILEQAGIQNVRSL